MGTNAVPLESGMTPSLALRSITWRKRTSLTRFDLALRNIHIKQLVPNYGGFLMKKNRSSHYLPYPLLTLTYHSHRQLMLNHGVRASVVMEFFADEQGRSEFVKIISKTSIVGCNWQISHGDTC